MQAIYLESLHEEMSQPVTDTYIHREREQRERVRETERERKRERETNSIMMGCELDKASRTKTSVNPIMLC